MFYYRLSITEKIDAPEGGKQLRNRTAFRTYGTGPFASVGEDAATILAGSAVISVKISKISQAQFVRATRPGD